MAFLQATVLTCAIVFLSTSPSECSKRIANPMVSSILKNIMSPSKPTNSDALQQLITMAAARNRGNPVLAEEFVVPNGFRPRTISGNTILPTNGITQSNAVLQSNGVVNNVMTQNPKMVQQFLAQPNFQQIEVARTMPVQPIEVARAVPFQQVEVARTMPVQPIEVARAVPFQQVEVARSVPLLSATQQAPAPLVNPFLPAASPVSALAPPTSNLLPPAEINRPRCNYLRKIPIPPPTL